MFVIVDKLIFCHCMFTVELREYVGKVQDTLECSFVGILILQHKIFVNNY
jgi:hypothetical protein